MITSIDRFIILCLIAFNGRMSGFLDLEGKLIASIDWFNTLFLIAFSGRMSRILDSEWMLTEKKISLCNRNFIEKDNPVIIQI
jgi:hypothetical protein